MWKKISVSIMALTFFGSIIFAQQNVIEDFKPSSVNQPGKKFPVSA